LKGGILNFAEIALSDEDKCKSILLGNILFSKRTGNTVLKGEIHRRRQKRGNVGNEQG